MKPTTVVIPAQRSVASADVRFGINKKQTEFGGTPKGVHALPSTGATACTCVYSYTIVPIANFLLIEKAWEAQQGAGYREKGERAW